MDKIIDIIWTYDVLYILRVDMRVSAHMHQGYILKVIDETSTITRVYEAVQNQI